MRRHLIVIWGALLASIAIYCGLVVMLSQSWESPSGDPTSNPVVLALAAAALGSLVVSFAIPARLLSVERSEGRVRTAYVIRWALLESVAIYGLLAAMLTRDVRIFYAFGAVAVAGMLLAFPSEEGTAGVPPASSRRPAGE